MSEIVAPARIPVLRRWILGLLPLVVLIAAIALVVGRGNSVIDLVGARPPAVDTFDVKRVEFRPGEIRILVRNPQPEALTIASVTVDNAVTAFRMDGPATLDRLRSATVIVPFDWVPNDPYAFGVTSSTGIETTASVAAAVATTGISGTSIFGFALIGVLVGVLPVVLGLGWLPVLRGMSPRVISGLLALTVGMLLFLAVDALAEAVQIQAALPAAIGGPGLILLGLVGALAGMLWVSRRGGSATPGEGQTGAGALRLATLIAVGIGLHNLGEGLAIGGSFAVGKLALGTSLIIGFMVQNLTEGLGIAVPVASRPIGFLRAVGLSAIAGLPVIVGVWIGGFLAINELAVVFLAIGAGAALAVVIEVSRGLRRNLPGGLLAGPVSGGLIAGIALMYVTGLFVG